MPTTTRALPQTDDEPRGRIADFSAELHSRAEGLLIDAPFALTSPPTDDTAAERQQSLAFDE
jgi:hypothetical protein